MTTIRRQRFKHIIGRTVLLIFGMFLAAFGIACTTRAGLGTTPISTVPYTASAITGLSFGTCTVILNFFFVAGQIVVLRSRYSTFNLLQIPIGFIFGAFIDPNEDFTSAAMAITKPSPGWTIVLERI